ncbi:MAG: site-2 protease family protein [Burkholderiales bacterium]
MKSLLVLLFGAGKFGKLLTTAGTMLLSVGAYALIFGWLYAVGFVALLFVHEMGHFIAARRRGLEVGAPTFIPFVGAWIAMKDMPRDAETEAYIGLAGPLVGTIGALICYALGRMYDSNLLLAIAYAGFFLNLFNLIPLSPFDGGRITAALSPKIWLLGVPMLVALFIYSPSPILILMAIIAAPQVWKAWTFDKDAPENAAYYTVSAQDRLFYGFMYVALAGYLSLMATQVHDMLSHLRS